MKKMHQHFLDNKDLSNQAGFDFYNFPNKVCWYPSAGFDFRHIAYYETFSKEWYNIENKPTVYVFTDHNIEGYTEKNETHPFRPGRIIYQDNLGDNKRTLTIKSCKELTLKKDFYNPYKSKSIDRGLLHFSRDSYSGKVFFIIAELNFIHFFRRTKIEVPIFYFTYENMNFLVDFLVKHQMRVNYLIHIKDGGGSFGGSSVPMNFIYQFQDTLKITNVLSDESIKTKSFNYQTDLYLIEDYLHSKQTDDNKILIELINKSIGHNDINSNWTEETIYLFNYGVSQMSEYKQKYIYQWKRV